MSQWTESTQLHTIFSLVAAKEIRGCRHGRFALSSKDLAIASTVCCSWRAVLTQPPFSEICDLCDMGEAGSNELVTRLVTRANGKLSRLCLCVGWSSLTTLVPLILPHLSALVEASFEGPITEEKLWEILEAAPHLRTCVVDLHTKPAAGAPAQLFKPHPALRLRRLTLDVSALSGDDSDGMERGVAMISNPDAIQPVPEGYDPQVWLSLLHALRPLKGPLHGLVIDGPPLFSEEACEALVRAVAEVDVHEFELTGCDRLSASLAAGLFACKSLHQLKLEGAFISRPGIWAGGAPAVAGLIQAIKVSTIHHVTLEQVHFWDGEHTDDALAALAAFTAHPHLHTLAITMNGNINACRAPEDAATARIGQALGTLVAADAAQLRVLALEDNGLGEGGLKPVFEALPGNTGLYGLRTRGNEVELAFVRDVALPAIKRSSLVWLEGAEPEGAIEGIDMEMMEDEEGQEGAGERERARMLAADALWREAEEWLDCRASGGWEEVEYEEDGEEDEEEGGDGAAPDE